MVFEPEAVEKLAMKGNPMPEGMDYPEQVLFQSFALLYARYREKHISRDDAKTEKLSFWKNTGSIGSTGAWQRNGQKSSSKPTWHGRNSGRIPPLRMVTN